MQTEGIDRAQPAGDDAARPPRYLLIEPCGSDFWLNVQHVVLQLLVAQIEGRRPVVHWPLGPAATAAPQANAFEQFFEAVSPLNLSMLVDAAATGTVHPPGWRAHRTGAAPPVARREVPVPFGRSETLVVSDAYCSVSAISPWIGKSSRHFGLSEDRIHAAIMAEQLRPVPAIVQKVEACARERLAGRPWVAVHVPGPQGATDPAPAAGLLAHSLAFVDRIVELNPRIGILLLTSDAAVLSACSQRHGSRIFCPATQRPGALDGIRPPGWADRARAEAQLIDALLAARCHYLVGDQGAGLSLAASRFKDWPHGQVFLLGQPQPIPEALQGPAPEPFQAATGAAQPTTCRLCGGTLVQRIDQQAPDRPGELAYRCTGCRSEQSARPPGQGAAPRDMGLARRTLAHAQVMPALLEALQFRKDRLALAIGSGSGLFTRLMRDAGYEFHSHDPHDTGGFAAGFQREGPSPAFALVTLLDEAYHAAEPASRWQQIFANDPDLVVGLLGGCAEAGMERDLLAPGAGTRGFAYSRTALATLAQGAGRQASFFGNWFIFSRWRLGEAVLGALQAWHARLPALMAQGFVPLTEHARARAAADHDLVTAFERLHQSGRAIVIDGVFFRFTSGIARVWKSLLQHWSASDLAPSLVVIDRGRTAPRLPGLRYVDAPPYDYGQMSGDRALLQRICDREQAGLFVSTYFTQPLTTPCALMVHDMIPEVLGFDLTNPQWVGKRLAIESAQAYLCVSRSTEADLLRFHPQAQGRSRRVVHNGCSFEAADATDVAAFRQRHGITRPYFMVSGSRTDYKNVELFFRAFARLGDERSQLAVVCTNANAPLEPEMAQLTGGAAAHMLVLSDHELQCAYSGALALVYPSRYEGFGLPVVEAMACACPVITCRNSSLGEVGGDAVLYVGEDRIDQMHQALLDVQSPGLRAALVERGLAQALRFSWSTMAREAGLALATWALERPGPA